MSSECSEWGNSVSWSRQGGLKGGREGEGVTVWPAAVASCRLVVDTPSHALQTRNERGGGGKRSRAKRGGGWWSRGKEIGRVRKIFLENGKTVWMVETHEWKCKKEYYIRNLCKRMKSCHWQHMERWCDEINTRCGSLFEKKMCRRWELERVRLFLWECLLCERMAPRWPRPPSWSSVPEVSWLPVLSQPYKRKKNVVCSKGNQNNQKSWQ